MIQDVWTEDVVEFKGRYYNILTSKIGPKPIQKPHLPLYLGGFTPNTFSRIAKYADGWLPAASGSLEYIANGIKTLREKEKEKKENKHLEVITLIFPEVNESNKKEGDERAPFRGSIDDVGNDLQRIKEMDYVLPL
ncbi:MAG TPA: LLM class flavin-dependent oxidoreductase [Candidatus Acidoferrum sp.]|nr:LLM class flavin-dependent oxidoreductase [Candidatus Acidoferrum sp.]